MARVDAGQFAIELARLASDHKCEDVLVLDLRGLSQITDYCIIATGSSDRQLRATTDSIEEYARKVGEKPYGIGGYDNASWILLDFVDVVVHLFAESYRQYYDLELLWGDAPHLTWKRSESA